MHAPRTHHRVHRGTTSHGNRAKWPHDTPQKQAQKSILTEKRRLFFSVYGLWLHHKHEDSGPRSVEPSRSPRFLGASQAKLRAPAPPPAQGPAAQSPPTLGSSLAALPPAFPHCRPCPAPAPHPWGPQQAPVLGHSHPALPSLGPTTEQRARHRLAWTCGLKGVQRGLCPRPRDSLPAPLRAANHTDTSLACV